MPFPFLALAISAAFSFIGQLLMPRPKNARASQLNEFRFPTATEDRPIPVLWGRVRQDAPNVVWYGDYSNKPIRKRTGLFSKTTVGYRYFVGFDLVIGYGDNVVIKRIKIDDKEAWTGSASSGTITIDRPTLYGDEDQGGLSATIEVYNGSYTQSASAYVASKVSGGVVPAYRGVAHLVFKGINGGGAYVGNQAEIKPIQIECERYPQALTGSAYSVINGDANPVECLYELMTNGDWGMGLAPSLFDTASWQAAAQQVAQEGLGFSAVWDTSGPLDEMIEQFQRFIDGVIVFDVQTGLLRLKLARPVSDPSSLPVINQSDIINIEYKRMSWSGTINEVRLSYRDRENDYADRVAIAQDFANAATQGEVISEDLDVRGVATANVANMIVARELQVSSVPLVQLRLRINRRAFTFGPADVFKLSHSPYGLSDALFRVTRVETGAFDSNVITVEAVEDVFGIGIAAYAAPSSSGWTSSASAAPSSVQVVRIIETPAAIALNDAAPEISIFAKRPSATTRAARLYVLQGTSYVPLINEPITFSPAGALVSSIARETSGTLSSVTINNVESADEVPLTNGIILVDDELMAYESASVSGATVTLTNVKRGVYDTTPATHAANADVFFVLDWQSAPLNASATLKVTALGFNGVETNIANEPTRSVTISRRALRPVAPKRLLIGGQYNPTALPTTGDVQLSWSDRTGETTTAFDVDDGAVDRTRFYTLKIYNGSTGALLRTVTGLRTSYTYTNANESADNGGSLAPSLIFVLYAERDGATSHQALTWAVARSSAPTASVTYTPAGAPTPPPEGAAYALGNVPVATTTPTSGQVLAYNGTAWVPTTISTGGGGGSLYTYNPDAPTGTPTSYDDEFEGSTLDSKWSYFNINTGEPFCVPALQGSQSLLRVGPRGTYSANNYQWCGITQTAPNGDFDFVAKVWPAYNLSAGGEYLLGMFALNASDSIWACALWYNTSWYARREYWTSPSSWGYDAAPSNALTPSYSYISPIYVRIKRSGSTLSMYFSLNRLYWAGLGNYNVSSINRIGVGARLDASNRSALTEAPYGYVDWFREVG